jgi:type II secretory pathway component PulM
VNKFAPIAEMLRSSSIGNWYAEKNATDRKVILAIVSLCLISTIYLAAWKPLLEYREAQTLRYERAQSLVDWITLNDNALQASSQNKSQSRQQKSLIPLVTASANQMQLKLNRLQPEQDGSVSISLQNQSFDQALRWIVDLETNSRLLIDRISIDRTENVGLVNVQLRIQ